MDEWYEQAATAHGINGNVMVDKTGRLVAAIYDQLQYVADSSISPADSLIWDGFLNGVETVQIDPNTDPQALLDALQGEIDDYMSTYE